MKSIIKIGLLFSVLAFSSCETEIVEKIDEFSFEQGGYMRQVTPFPVTAFTVSKANLAGTKIEFVAEAVTPNSGALFASYDLVVRFVDRTGGTSSKPDVALKSIPASAYTKDATTGYPRATITITGKEMQDKLGLTDADLTATDRFEVRGTMKLTNGKSYNAANTGANITGGAFYSSPFLHQANVAN
ncbi:hypothetical protein [Haliscomenobacter sp.]|uniref:hypothetical protein n=1 Tax=Haliscomenobacter sp. TaxID=2717303 RepID=UPI0035939F71